MNRRSFVKESAAAAAGLAAGRTLAANDRLQLGFVGVGGRGQWLARAFDAIGREKGLCRIVAVCDVWEKRRREVAERYQCQGYTDYREMIECERPDIVSITTPATHHCEAVLFAAEHGARAIYCEKALCCSLAEADQMVAAVESHGIKFNTGTLRRWAVGMETVREMIERGDLGHLQAVISYAVGGMLHSASHFFDLMLYLAGDPGLDWAQGTVPNTDFDPQADRWHEDLSGLGQVRFSNGVMCHLLSTGLWAEFAAIGSEGAGTGALARKSVPGAGVPPCSQASPPGAGGAAW